MQEECGGKGLCEDGRQRYNCKECGGKGICEHGRVRSRCKECGGKDICEHGRRRNDCKECGGKGICEHGRQRRYCKECRAAAAGSSDANASKKRKQPQPNAARKVESSQKRARAETSAARLSEPAAEGGRGAGGGLRPAGTCGVLPGGGGIVGVGLPDGGHLRGLAWRWGRCGRRPTRRRALVGVGLPDGGHLSLGRAIRSSLTLRTTRLTSRRLWPPSGIEVARREAGGCTGGRGWDEC